MQVVQIGVISDLYRAGMTEDGQEYSAEQFFVVAETEDGNTYEHFMNFHGCEVKQGEEGLLFYDVRAEARAKAEALAERIRHSVIAGKPLNLDYWVERRQYGRAR